MKKLITILAATLLWGVAFCQTDNNHHYYNKACVFRDTLVVGDTGLMRLLYLTPASGSRILTVNSAGDIDSVAISAGGGWSLIGNSGTAAGTNYVGTNDGQDLYFYANQGAGTGLMILGQDGALNLGSGNTANIIIGNGAAGGTVGAGGQMNTIIGAPAANSLTTGIRNTALGRNALSMVISGDNNTAIGYKADISSSSGINRTALGAFAYCDQDNSLILGGIDGANGATASTFVGIGTPTPDANLHVVGATHLQQDDGAGNILEASIGTNATSFLNTFATGQKAQIGTNTPASTAIAFMQVYDASNNPWSALIDSTHFYVGTGIGDDAKFNVNLNGNVGIGIQTPTAKLDVVGGVKTSGYKIDGFTLLNDAEGSETDALKIANTTGFDIYSQTSDLRIQNIGTGNTLFNNAGGNVGIGIANPNAKLFVSGNNVDPVATFLNGNVGIGTATPTAILEVNGTVYFEKISDAVPVDTMFFSIGDSIEGLPFGGIPHIGQFFGKPLNYGGIIDIEDMANYGGGIQTVLGMRDNSSSEKQIMTLSRADTKIKISNAAGDSVNIVDFNLLGTRFTNSNGNYALNLVDIDGGTAIGSSYSGASLAPTNGLIVEGNTGIGTPTPTATLQAGDSINSATLRYVDGNQAASKVLTSDANGYASWQAPTSTIMAVNYLTPATGDTVAVTSGSSNIIDPGGNIAALTVSLPSTPANGQQLQLAYMHNIVTLTYINGTVHPNSIRSLAGTHDVLTYYSGIWY